MFPGRASRRRRSGVRGEGGADLIGERDRDDSSLEAHRHTCGRHDHVTPVRLAAALDLETDAPARQTEAADAPPHAAVDDVPVSLQLGERRALEPSEPGLEPAIAQL